MLEQLIRKRKQNRFQKKLLTYFIPYIDKILSVGGYNWDSEFSKYWKGWVKRG